MIVTNGMTGPLENLRKLRGLSPSKVCTMVLERSVLLKNSVTGSGLPEMMMMKCKSYTFVGIVSDLKPLNENTLPYSLHRTVTLISS